MYSFPSTSQSRGPHPSATTTVSSSGNWNDPRLAPGNTRAARRTNSAVRSRVRSVPIALLLTLETGENRKDAKSAEDAKRERDSYSLPSLRSSRPLRLCGSVVFSLHAGALEAREDIGEEEVEAVGAREVEEVDLHVADADAGERLDLLRHLVRVAADDVHIRAAHHRRATDQFRRIVRDTDAHVAGREDGVLGAAHRAAMLAQNVQFAGVLLGRVVIRVPPVRILGDD